MVGRVPWLLWASVSAALESWMHGLCCTHGEQANKHSASCSGGKPYNGNKWPPSTGDTGWDGVNDTTDDFPSGSDEDNDCKSPNF